MAPRRRTIHDDGLTRVEELWNSDTPTSQYKDIAPDGGHFHPNRKIGGFEHLISDVEPFYQETLDKAGIVLPPAASDRAALAVWMKEQRRATRTRPLPPLSLEAYARRGMWSIRRIRRYLAEPQDDPTTEGMIVEAFRLGHDLAEARWRFNLGAFTRAGLSVRTASREQGLKRGKARQALQKQNRAAIEKELGKLQRPHSQRRAAGIIGGKLKMSAATVRNHLRAIAKLK